MDQQALQSFIAEYTGKNHVGDTEDNVGQCVGLVEVYIDALKLPHIWGNAKDLFTNADSGAYLPVSNTATNFPEAGDILIFDGTFGGGVGHCGIVVSADVNSFQLFEQNDVTNSDPNGACEVKQYDSYAGVIGWLIPHVQPVQPQPSASDGIQQLVDSLRSQRDNNDRLFNSLLVALFPDNSVNSSQADAQAKGIARIQDLLSKEQELVKANATIAQYMQEESGEDTPQTQQPITTPSTQDALPPSAPENQIVSPGTPKKQSFSGLLSTLYNAILSWFIKNNS